MVAPVLLKFDGNKCVRIEPILYEKEIRYIEFPCGHHITALVERQGDILQNSQKNECTLPAIWEYLLTKQRDLIYDIKKCLGKHQVV